MSEARNSIRGLGCFSVSIKMSSASFLAAVLGPLEKLIADTGWRAALAMLTRVVTAPSTES
jgi:hypothetical protein